MGYIPEEVLYELLNEGIISQEEFDKLLEETHEVLKP